MDDDPGSRPAARPPIRSRTFEALENRDYRRFYIGYGISLVGSWLQTAAVKWIVFDKTGSEWMLGLIEAAALMPGLVVGLFAGAMADRVVPRTMILSMQLIQMALAFVLAALVGLGIEQIWQMALIVALTRVCVTFEMPSRHVFLFDLVGRAVLMNAIALNTGLFNASRVVGPSLAGVCLSQFGGAACFALNGATYLAAIAALVSIRLDRRSPPASKGPGEILGGFAYLRRDRRVRTLYILMAAFGILGMGYDAMIPAFARKVVGTDVNGYSLLLACSGVGATLGALAVASLGGLRRKERLVTGGMLLFGAALFVAAWLPGVLLEVAGRPVALAAASACLLLVGFGAVMFYSATQTMIQTAVPDHLRGRIMGVWMIVYSASVPLGAMWTGAVAQVRGVPPIMELSAGLCGVVALTAHLGGWLAEPPAPPLARGHAPREAVGVAEPTA